MEIVAAYFKPENKIKYVPMVTNRLLEKTLQIYLNQIVQLCIECIHLLPND